VDLPAFPAWPRHEAREDRQQPHGRRAGVAVLAPAPIGPGGDTEGLGYLCGGEARALLQRAQRGQIDREAFGEELGIRALEAATARARVILTRLSVCQRKLQMSCTAQSRNVRSGPGKRVSSGAGRRDTAVPTRPRSFFLLASCAPLSPLVGAPGPERRSPSALL